MIARHWRGVGVAAFAMGATLLAVEAMALGLGEATVSSGLGEPLRLSISVTLQPDEDVGCVTVRPHGDDLPSVFNTRSQVLRSGAQTRIEIRSPAAVDEPAIGLVVSVGCSSPVARDYVLFLDPPVVGARADLAEATPLVNPAATSRRPPRTRPPASDAASATSAGSTGPSVAPVRPPRKRAPATATPSPLSDAATSRPATTANPPATRTRPSTGGDRLSVVPTEPPVIGRTSPSPQPGYFPPPVSSATPPASASSAGSASPTIAAGTAAPAAGAAPASAAPMPADASATTAPPAADAEAAAREEALRQQQAMLQLQIKNLGDQIAALRVQATSLAVRNQALEGTTVSPTLLWLLIALAVIAILVASWMAWRYMQLRRSLEQSAWWAGQAAQAGEEAVDEPLETNSAREVEGLSSRATGRPAPTFAAAETRSQPPSPSNGASAVQITNVDLVKPPVRASGSVYPAAMDTDFTVSDIEAAMATVRTVTLPRTEKPGNALDDTDFGSLGGPTITSPFSEQPPAPAAADDELAHFVDLDIAPMHAPRAGASANPSSAPAPSPADPFDGHIEFTPRIPPLTTTKPRSPVAPPVDADHANASDDLAFRLDIPEGFDPLAPDSLKTTIIERSVSDMRDLDTDHAPTSLDFELPSQTQIIAMTTFDENYAASPVRHGATALHDLFAPIGSDTVLDLNERDGAPLSTTEIDRITGPDADPTITVAGLTGRSRMARFADMITQLDEIATADPLAAVARLRQYVLREESIPTLLWLRLFELYKVVDKRPVYDALADHFARRYHRPMVAWSETLADRTPQRPLSALAEIDRQIESQWGTEAGARYVETLLCDRTQDDAIVFNAVLQRDLLDAAKIYPDVMDDDSRGDRAPPAGASR